MKSKTKLQNMKTTSKQSQNFGEENTKKTSSEKSDELVKMQKVEGTPFYLVHEKDKSSGFLALGMHRLSENCLDTVEDAMNFLETEKWNIIAMVSQIVFNTLKK